MSMRDYEMIIGLEVHVELKTDSKIFCSCPTTFGAPPNTQCCPICMGLPGAMPRLNRRAVELAVVASLAVEAEICPICRMDRKNYFYPDLPKAYQISQADFPISQNGRIDVCANGEARTVRIERIHIEEDAGKLIHGESGTRVDANRCGVPLIEIVSAPDMRSAEEASAYLRTLREILVACGVSDCKMQEGAFRCDVNLSLRKKGSETLGVRTETKNINSFSFVEKAIRYEAKRQAELLDRGERIRRETRRFDATSGETHLMRVKETEADYRFFPEPDLPPFCISKEEIERLRMGIPELPAARAARFCREYDLPMQDAQVLTSDAALALYFEKAATRSAYPRLLSNMIRTELLRLQNGTDGFSVPVSAERLASLCQLVGEGRINSSTAKKLLLRLTKEDFDPVETVALEGLEQISDRGRLHTLVLSVIEEKPRAVEDYLNGRSAALRALEGTAMAKTGGRAEPVLLEKIFLEELEKRKS